MFLIRKNWMDLLSKELNSEAFKNFQLWLNNEYKTKTIYPKPELVFNAVNHVDINDVKVVIIGQDPYHEPNQAHGLCFSVEKDNIPPSLNNIFKELQNDLKCYIPNHGNLTKWAKQGVLLLNSVLTVEQGKANSHKGKGWEVITKKIIQLINNRNDPVIFLLWGGNAKAVACDVNRNKHIVFESVHPSPLSANKGGWFGNNHFSKVNKMLIKLNKRPIDWQIENV